MVFVLCLVVMVMTGLARFSGQPFAAGVWLDVLFLVSAAICLSLVIVRLGRRLRETTERHWAEEHVDGVDGAGGAEGAGGFADGAERDED